MTYYFKLNEGYDALTLRDVTQPTLNLMEQSPTQTTVTWVADKDLVICQEGFFFNGQCCARIDLSLANFKIYYSLTTNFIIFSTDNTTINSYLYGSIKANFSLLSVGNDFNTTYMGSTMSYSAYLKLLLTQNQTSTFNVSSIAVSPKAYSIVV